MDNFITGFIELRNHFGFQAVLKLVFKLNFIFNWRIFTIHGCVDRGVKRWSQWLNAVWPLNFVLQSRWHLEQRAKSFKSVNRFGVMDSRNITLLESGIYALLGVRWCAQVKRVSYQLAPSGAGISDTHLIINMNGEVQTVFSEQMSLICLKPILHW